MALEPLVRLRATWRRSVHPHGALTLFCMTAVAGAEIVGRRASSNLVDALFVGLFLFAAVLIGSGDATDPPIAWLGPAERAARRFVALLASLHVDVGVDLREEPPLERGWPAQTIRSTVGGLVVLGALIPLLRFLPDGMRWVGVHSSYSAYLIVLAGLWMVSLLGAFFMLVVLVAVIHDAFLRSYAGPLPRPRGTEAACVTVALVAVLAAGITCPVSAAAVGLAGLIALHVLVTLIPGSPPLLLLWRRDPDSPARTVPWDWHMASEPVRIALLVLVLVALMRGPALLPGDVEAHISVTSLMGDFLAWSGLAGLGALSAFNFHLAWTARRRNPSGPSVPTLHVAYASGRPFGRRVRRRLAAALAERGMAVRFAPAAEERGDVPVVIDATAGEVELAWPMPPAWPRRVRPDELLEPDTLRALTRRHEIVQRRLLLRGLERLFKRAAGLEFERGSGFWVAPHLWFVLGLSRDEDEESGGDDTGVLEQMVGPRYDRIVPMSARRHFYAVMRGVQLDIIFVEDGVDFRRLRAVLRMLFEVYDIHGGGMAARSRHFAGLPGVRVMIHDHGPDEPFKVEGYPEPDYEGLGRARILHVFRDRGEEDEDVPVDPSRRLEPLLV